MKTGNSMKTKNTKPCTRVTSCLFNLVLYFALLFAGSLFPNVYPLLIYARYSLTFCFPPQTISLSLLTSIVSRCLSEPYLHSIYTTLVRRAPRKNPPPPPPLLEIIELRGTATRNSRDFKLF